MVIDLFTEQAPTESKNFIKLCKAKYYNFAPFYNIQKDFIVELGDPMYPINKTGCSAWGLSDPSRGKSFKTSQNKLPKNRTGAVSLITQSDSTDPDERFATSIFTITLKDIEDRNVLKNNVVFGQVTEGFEILEAINNAFLDDDHSPLQDIRLHHTYILEDPFDDIEGLTIPAQSPEPTAEQLSTVKLADIEDIDLDKEEELTEEQFKERQNREADSKALTLEIIGDLPSAEVKPMENVLFVCKLNPLTRDEDLEIIFSRFGKIISCEVMKDKSTGDSLQYAFIEYEEKKSCEAAYFKMDEVLIDDRRIHVDFSQSVSRLSEAWRNETNAKREKKHGGSTSDTSRNYRDRDYNRNSSSRGLYRSGESSESRRGSRHGGTYKTGERGSRDERYRRERYDDGSRRDERYNDRYKTDRERDHRHRSERHRSERERDSYHFSSRRHGDYRRDRY